MRFTRGNCISLSSDISKHLKDGLTTHVIVLVDKDTRQVALEPANSDMENGYMVSFSTNAKDGSAKVAPTTFVKTTFKKDAMPFTVDATIDTAGRVLCSIPSRHWL
jgi:hypothetical protein